MREKIRVYAHLRGETPSETTERAKQLLAAVCDQLNPAPSLDPRPDFLPPARTRIRLAPLSGSQAQRSLLCTKPQLPKRRPSA